MVFLVWSVFISHKHKPIVRPLSVVAFSSSVMRLVTSLPCYMEKLVLTHVFSSSLVVLILFTHYIPFFFFIPTNHFLADFEWNFNEKFKNHNFQEQNKNHKVLNAFNPVDKTSYSDMIHIDVPDTKQLVERSDGITKYTVSWWSTQKYNNLLDLQAYNIHINGWYHGSVRFSHLYEFAELIKQKFSQRYKGPEFPAKKLFKLDPKAIDERRQKISKYFQACELEILWT